MKKLFWISAFLFSLAAFGDDSGVVLEPVGNDEFLKFLLASLGGLKGAGALAIAGFAVQAIIRLLKTPMVNSFFLRIGGEWKITIVTGLTVAAGVIGLMISGVPLVAALIHSTTLSAFLVFFNQIYRHFSKREPAKLGPSDPASPPSPMTVLKDESPKTEPKA